MRLLRSLLPLVLLATAAQSAWDPDPAVNVPVSIAPGAGEDLFCVSDGAGGVIVVFEEERDGDLDLYAQRIDVNGDPLWTTNGVLVCGAGGDQHVYRSSTGTTGFTPVIPDGAGGVWIAWHDGRFFGARQNDIYLQRLDADGVALLDPDGLPIATGAGMEDQPTLCPDGAGGVFVVWQDKNTDPIFYDLFGQRVSATGDRLWNGGAPRPLVVLDWDQDAPVLVSDGTGGAFLAWTDSRDNLNDVFAQRLAADGTEMWTPQGVAVAQSANSQDAITMIRSEDGDPILTWVDRRLGSPDIYAQRLDAADGSPRWGFGGTAVCLAPESQYRPAVATDGAGGAYVSWFDYRNAPSGPPWELDIYLQRMLASGTPAFAANGIPVCAAPDAQRDADVWPDGGGGVFVAWEDNRSGTGREDIYAQHVNGAGAMLLEANGVAVSVVSGNQQRPDPVAGAGGVVMAWSDDRHELFVPDVYAERVLVADTAVLGVNRVRVDLAETGGDSRVVVSNVGVAPLTVDDISLADGGAGFTLGLSAAVPAVLGPGEGIEATVGYDPGLGAGIAEDLLLVAHDAPVVATGPAVGSPVEVPLRAGGATVAVSEPATAIPSLALHPSPFRSATRLSFTLDEATHVRASVHDVAGRRVRVLLDRRLAAGTHRVRWDGRDHHARPLPPGVYTVWVRTGAVVTSRKVVRLGASDYH
jgi:hypothetical protein